MLDSKKEEVDDGISVVLEEFVLNQSFICYRFVQLFAKHLVLRVPGVTHVRTSRGSYRASETFTLFKNFVTFHNMAYLTSECMV